MTYMDLPVVAEGVVGLAALLTALFGGVTILQRRVDGAGKLMGWSALTLFIGYALYLVPRALAGLAGLENAFLLLCGRMAAAIAVTVFCILLSLLWEKLYAKQNGFFAEAHIREMSGVRALACLLPVFVWLSALMQGETADPLADEGPGVLIIPAVRCVTLLVIVAVVAWHWRKTRRELPTLQPVWCLLALSLLFGVAADLGAALIPALELFYLPQLACLLAITLRFVRFAGETGEKH